MSQNHGMFIEFFWFLYPRRQFIYISGIYCQFGWVYATYHLLQKEAEKKGWHVDGDQVLPGYACPPGLECLVSRGFGVGVGYLWRAWYGFLKLLFEKISISWYIMIFYWFYCMYNWCLYIYFFIFSYDTFLLGPPPPSLITYIFFLHKQIFRCLPSHRIPWWH